MKNWITFIFGNKRLLNFGFLFNFFSSFGQTFFISLFVPFWIETFKISNATFGSLYAIVTVISAFLLSMSGKYIDRMPLRKFGVIVFSGLIISVTLLAQSYTLLMLIGTLFLVRFFGQGLMTHTSSTGVARYFINNRGKALGLTALGHPAGQFFIPLVVAFLIGTVGWRYSLHFMAAAAFILLIPSLWAITSLKGLEPDIPRKDTSVKTGSSIRYLKKLKFWVLSLNIFVMPFLCTALFLYQYSLGQSKGWDITWVAFSFSFFAIFNAIAIIASGDLIDRFSGVKLFPLYLLPAIVSLLMISFYDQKWVFPLFYALLGISAGLGSTINTAVQVEVFGVNDLGKVRSYLTTVVILGTAIAPPVFGFFIDLNYSYSFIMLFFAGFATLIAALSFKLWKVS